MASAMPASAQCGRVASGSGPSSCPRLSRTHIGPLAPIGQRADSNCMARILVVNPNSSIACSDAISTALDPFRLPGAPSFDVTTLREGPPAIYDWRDWHSVVDPLCRLVEREPAAAYVIA